jgi:hypothetical protein
MVTYQKSVDCRAVKFTARQSSPSVLRGRTEHDTSFRETVTCSVISLLILNIFVCFFLCCDDWVYPSSAACLIQMISSAIRRNCKPFRLNSNQNTCYAVRIQTWFQFLPFLPFLDPKIPSNPSLLHVFRTYLQRWGACLRWRQRRVVPRLRVCREWRSVLGNRRLVVLRGGCRYNVDRGNSRLVVPSAGDVRLLLRCVRVARLLVDGY